MFDIVKPNDNEILVVKGEDVICRVVIQDYLDEATAHMMATHIAVLLSGSENEVWEVSSSDKLSDEEKNNLNDVEYDNHHKTYADKDAIEKAVDDAFELAKQGKAARIKRY